MNPTSTAAAEAHARTTELLREIRRIEIQTSRLVDQHLAGSYHSMFKGRGVAFSEVRTYEPGDDVRAIDWNVTARTGEPHIKLFTEERELTVLLVVDMSASLSFGSTAIDKRGLVARLVATFAFSAIRNNDKVGLLGFTDKIEVYVPPRSGRKHVLAVIQRILTQKPEGRATRPEVALGTLARMSTSHAVVILISDFVDVLGESSGKEFERALEIARRRHDLIPVRVEDPLELALPPLGIVSFEDLEWGDDEDAVVDLSKSSVARFGREVERERTRFDALMRRLHLDAVSIRTGELWQQSLVRFFERRSRRMRR